MVHSGRLIRGSPLKFFQGPSGEPHGLDLKEGERQFSFEAKAVDPLELPLEQGVDVLNAFPFLQDLLLKGAETAGWVFVMFRYAFFRKDRHVSSDASILLQASNRAPWEIKE